jgi:hypothetical protein
VTTAVGAVGRGNASHNAIRAHIIKRANSLDCASLIPDNWNSDGSLKADGASSANGDAFAPPPPPPPPAKPADGASPAPAAPPKAPTPPAAGGKPDGAAAADATISEAIKALATAADNAVKAQQADPDNASDPKDAKVLAGLEQVQAILGQVQKDQAADAGETASTAPPAPDADKAPAPPAAPPAAAPAPPATTAAGGPPVAPPAATPGNAEGIPGDADDSPPGPGDIEADVQCQNPQCGHPAGVHEDTQDGANTGHCQNPQCECPGMVPNADQVNGPDDQSQGTAPPADGDDQNGTQGGGGNMGADKFAPPPAPPAAAPAPDAPPVEGAPAPALPPISALPETVGPAFTIPVAALENVPTGDGRIIQPDALTWRTPPLPLMGLKTSPHDPSGMSSNDPAVLIGRIEEVARDGQTIVMSGHLLNTPEGMDFANILEQMGRMGLSIDVGSAEVTVTADPAGPGEPGAPDVFDVPLMEQLTAGEIMGATVCPFAAFAGAYIVLGDDPTAGAGAKLEMAPADAKMAIRYVGSETCEPCEAASLVASGGPPSQAGGPLAPPKAWFDAPNFGHTEDGTRIDPREDPRLRETIDSKRGKPSGKFACPITVTEDGRVFGHVAQWGVCHQSAQFISQGQCVMAPRSKTDYALFHRGHVLTAEGELISVGALTADAGHAPEQGITAAQAVAHYDNSALTAAVVRAGEDEFGIWVAGSVHPAASPEQVFTLRSNPPSGDWRPYGAGTELRAVLHVNVPGFPMVQAKQVNGRMESLVAAGVPMFDAPPAPELTLEQRLAALEVGYIPVASLAKEALIRQMAEVRAG